MSTPLPIKKALFAFSLLASQKLHKHDLILEKQDTEDTGNIQVDYTFHLHRSCDAAEIVMGSMRITDRHIHIRYIETIDKSTRRKGYAAIALSMLIEKFPNRKIVAVYPRDSAMNFWSNLYQRLGAANIAEPISMDESRQEVREYVNRATQA